ncbi:histidine kinase N-terminal 7TM domain-containing protein [Saliphagus sp. GCM10025334]
MSLTAWPVAASLLAGVGTLVLVGYLWKYRNEPGAYWFLLTLSCQAVWCFAYACALLVYDPAARLALEMVVLVSMNWIGPLFLGFALTYTGRANIVRSWSFQALLGTSAVTTALILTNPIHGLVWTGFALNPVYGVAAASYTLGGWGYVAIGIGMLTVAAGTMVLFDTVLSYGPLYRREALAVGLSAFPPGIALFVWAFELGATPQLNLTTIMFLPHVVLDGYAFVSGRMFEFSPVTRRTVERNAIEELENPVVALDTDDRLVTYNDSAARLFDSDGTDDPLGRELEDVTGTETEIDLETDDQVVSVATDGGFREFTCSNSTLQDPMGASVGRLLVFQDVTTQRRRKQRLEILNRVLRHNLRNELNAAHGYIGMVAEQLEDEALRDQLAGAQADVEGVIAMGEKAWAFERVVETVDEERTPVSLREAATSAAGTFDHRRGEIDVDVPESCVLSLDRPVLEHLFEQLLENGLEHSDADVPRVRVALEGTSPDGSTAIVTVADDGPGIPDHELTVLERGTETALQHGSGIGLWVIVWCTQTLGADLTFDSGPDGTTVRLELPGVVEAAPGIDGDPDPDFSAERGVEGEIETK